MDDLTHIAELLKAPGRAILTDAQSARQPLISTGFRDLDAVLGGWSPGDFVIVGARPSLGKTSLVLDFARNAAMNGGSVAYFSLEMRAQQLIGRLLDAEAGIDTIWQGIRQLDERQKARIKESTKLLSKLAIQFNDSSSLTIDDLTSKVERLRDERGVDLVVVDYLQLMSTAQQQPNRAAEMSDIAHRLKRVARDLGVVVIGCSQLSRSAAQRVGGVPILSDLSYSGSIEDTADVVIFICRETDTEMWGELQDRSSSDPLLTKLVIAKHRNGPTGTIHVRFRQTIGRFEDLLILQNDDWEGE